MLPYAVIYLKKVNVLNENNQSQNAPKITYEQWVRYRKHKNAHDRKEIRYIGLMTGAAILTMFLAENVIVLLLQIVGLYDNYLNDVSFQAGADMIIRVLTTLVPFLFFAKFIKERTKNETLVPLVKPNDPLLSVLGVFSGLGFCMIANIATSYLTVIIEAFGFKLSSPDDPGIAGQSGFLITVLRVAILAPLIEEIALRGCTMQPLRKFGDGFAIVMSACAFGLMHCNLIQAPFALIAGLILGYVTIKTGSLWTAFFIHALNNFISVAFTHLFGGNANEQIVTIVYSFIIYGLIFVGLISFLLFTRREKKFCIPQKNFCLLSRGQKIFAYLSSPTIIIAIVIMLRVTSTFVKRA